MPLNTAQKIVACVSYKAKVDLSMELAPALRPAIWSLIEEFSTKMRRQGRWATARNMAKVGFPIELALAAVYY